MKAEFCWRKAKDEIILTTIFVLTVIATVDLDASNFRVVGYLGGTPRQLKRMTHWIPTFVSCEANGKINEADLSDKAALAHAYGVKCIVSFDGANFHEMTDNADGSRTNFVNNLLNYCHTYSFDGANFDWEIGGGFPETERNNYSALIQECHKAFESHDLTVSIDGYYRHELDSTGIANIDWIDTMAYEDLQQGINMVSYWEGLGAPREKICMGMAAGWRDYGHDMSLAATKTQYCLDNGYGGVMLFRTDLDRKEKSSMLKTVYNIIQANKQLAKPTPAQASWQDMEIGMFIHFGLETWQDTETDDFSTSLEQVNPTKLDTRQWVSVAESMGAKYIIFVAKHAGGFCWWQTDTTDYSVKNIPWQNGKGDVMRDLSESCRKRGIKLGVYLSPQDLKHGAKVSGKCETAEAQARYNKIYRQQLTELLSRYGKIFEVWFDGSCVIEVGDILKKYAPNAMVFQSKYATIRWVGNEGGYAPYPAWNAVSKADAKSGVSTAKHGATNGDVWLPIECDTTMRDHYWFWSTTNADTLKSIDQLMEIYYNSVGHGANLLLDLAPDTTGLIPEADAKRAAEFGAEIKRRFGKSIAETKGRGDVVELSLGKPTTIDHVITMEDITKGERVREYVVEGLVDGNWQKICEGTAIGHKKIDRFEPVEMSKVRFRCTKFPTTPIIRKFAVYYTALNSTGGVKND